MSTVTTHSVPRAATVLSLLFGRVSYRVGMYGAGLALLALWGPEQFALYATATGAAGWLFALSSSGPEKAALVLLPRYGAAGLERRFLALAVLPSMALSLLAAAAWFALPLSSSRFFLAAALSTAVGGCAVLVGLHRLRGEPGADIITYLVIACGYAVAVAVAALTDVGVGGVLWLLLTVALLVLATLALRLWPRSHRAPVPARLRVEFWRAVSVLGIGELVGMVAFSMLFAFFAVADDPHETSLFYVLVVATSCFSVGVLYFLRLLQPHVVARSEAHGESVSWRTARRLLLALLAAGAPASVLCAVLAVQVDRAWAAWVALVLEMALFGLVSVAILLLESSGARGRGWSAAAAVVELLVIAATGWWLVQAAGAAGAFVALSLGIVVKAGLLAGVGSAPLPEVS